MSNGEDKIIVVRHPDSEKIPSLWVKDYAMVFWANEDRHPVETILNANEFFGGFGDEFIFRYLNERVRIAIDRKALAERCAPEKRKDELLTQSYFSRNRVWLVLSTGVTEYFTRVSPHMRPLPEVLKLEFDAAHIEGVKPAFPFKRLREVFYYCLDLFEPYYGGMDRNGEINDPASHYQEISYSIDHTKVPTTVEWFNYFGPEMVECLGGVDKLLAAPAYSVEKVEETSGIVLILQREPFDYRRKDDLRRRRAVEDFLELSELHNIYRKQ